MLYETKGQEQERMITNLQLKLVEHIFLNQGRSLLRDAIFHIDQPSLPKIQRYINQKPKVTKQNP